MGSTSISLTETKSIQEDARKKYADGSYSLADYLNIIMNNPLKFTSTKRSRPILTKEKGKIRIVSSRYKIKHDNH